MQSLQNLTFMVSLMDRVSGPAGGIMHTMDNVTTRIQQGYQKIGYGLAGVIGTGVALDRLLSPTKEMQAALGSVKSLNVADDVLSKLQNTALKFSLQYGSSAADFVAASYQIQSAIAGLSGNELPAFTNALAILAKGTKADVNTITDYGGTMYTIFQKTADQMGRAKWVDQLAGQTAMAVNIFKSDGMKMAAGFENLGATGYLAGIKMNEQLAVLGKLQGAMSGSESGTTFKRFLDSVGSAGADLGLKFTDSKDHLLPVIDVLEKIRNKFGEINTETKIDLIKTAFGSDYAVDFVKILSSDVVGLKTSIDDIGKENSLTNVIKMANAFTMPWDQATQGVNALQIMLGTQLMPEITKFFGTINSGIGTLMRWGDLFPELSRGVSLAGLGIFGLIAGVSVLSIVMGVATLASGGFAAILAIITSPITFAVLGVVGLVTAVGAAIIKWDEWGGAILYVGKAITDAFGITGILQSFWSLLNGIYTGWSLIFTTIYDNAGGILSFIGDVVGAVGQIVDILGRALGFAPLLDWVENLLSMIVSGWKMIAQMTLPNWMQSAIGMTPGINVMGGVPKPIAAPAGINGGVSSKPGGLMQQFQTKNTNQSRSIGTLMVNNYGKAPSLAELADNLLMGGG